NWVFGDKQTGIYLLKFSWFPIERHVLIQGKASPDDPDLKDYWAQRNLANAMRLLPQKRMIQKQNGICPKCGDNLVNNEEIHSHHMKPKSKGGQDTESNLE